jgi:hypothetical protein
MLFLRGNHEATAWLRGLPVDPATGTAPVDPFDLLRYVPDGAVLRPGGARGVRLAFLGGVEEQTDERGIDPAAYARLLALGPGAVDVLVAHEGHYGTSTGYRGDVHGSPLLTRLLARTRPPFFLFAHAHRLIGPGAVGPTTYLGLDGLVASLKWHPEARGLRPGCLAVLDTAAPPAGRLWPVTEPWLAAFPTLPFDVDAWADAFLRRGSGASR